jgi:flagellar motor switch protein FliN/FliY
MSNGLSQEEINALLVENVSSEEAPKKKKRRGRKENTSQKEISDEETKEGMDKKPETILTDIERDILGEVGNISMGSASTALSDMIGKRVNITTPIISITTLKKMRESFEIPNIALEIKYVTGIIGKNILIMKISDAAIVANLMMGQDGRVVSQTLSEIEESAVSEAMNQMIGSAATAMATMFSRKVDISPPKSKIWDSMTSNMSEDIEEEEDVIEVAFRLHIENLLDSVIMQVLSVDTVKKIISIMMGTEEVEESIGEASGEKKSDEVIIETKQDVVEKVKEQIQSIDEQKPEPKEAILNSKDDYRLEKVEYKQFNDSNNISKNTCSLLDVPLNIQVVLGNAKRSIKEIMNFSSGTLLELNQMVGQPVELHVNGKIIAYGEAVTINGNLAINIIDVNKNDI